MESPAMRGIVKVIISDLFIIDTSFNIEAVYSKNIFFLLPHYKVYSFLLDTRTRS